MSLLQAGFGSSGDAYEITDSLRLRSSASAYLSRTPASAGNRRTWTLSWWAKRGALGSTGFTVFSAGTGTSGDTGELVIKYDNNYPDSLAIQTTNTNVRFTNALYRDPSAWHHVVVAFDTTQATASNRTKVYVNGAQITSFNISNDLAQNTDTAVNNNVTQEIGVFARINTQYFDGYLTEVQMIDGQQLDADDFGEYDANGTWKPKEYTGTYGTNGFYLPMKPTTQAELQNTVLYAGTGATQSIDGCGYAPDLVWTKSRSNAQNHELYDSVRGSQKYLLVDTTVAEGTAANGLASFDTDGFSVGSSSGSAVNISGQSLVAWTWDAGDNQPSTGHSSVLYTGTAAPRSVKGFGFSPDLIIFKGLAASSPLLIDSVRGPFKELQPNSTGAETSNSGTRIASIDADGFSFASTSAGGLNASGNNYVAWGWDAGSGSAVSNTDGDINSTVKANDATGFSVVSYTGNGTSNSEQTIGHGLSTAPKVVIVKDRTSASTRWAFYSTDLSSDGTYAVKNLLLNSTAAESAYSSQIRGIQGSNTFSVRDVDANGNANVNKSGDNYIAYCFSEVSGVSKFGSYTGTGSSGNAITGLGFRPGFLMIKETSSTGNWAIVDGTRSPFGEVTGNYLYLNLSQAEGGGSAPLQFDSDGFTINSGDSDTNTSGQTYIYMAFKGSYSDHVSPLNDTGSIDSRVKANPGKGFSIVSYEGTGGATTVGHGLSSAPEMIIFKNRDGSYDWATYHKDLTSAAYTVYLSLNYAQSTNSTVAKYYNSTDPTSSVFSIGASNNYTNLSSNKYIAYCFHSVAGYSKIDKYTGNGSTTGPTITTGFRPAFVMIKSSTNSGTDWLILDGTRSPNNTRNKVLFANLANVEAGTGYGDMDVSDTGFQIKTNGASSNASGQTYIYMAFADTADAVFNFDASGNKNNFDANNINSNAESETTYDLMKDTPSLVDENAGNFATFNPLAKTSSASTSNANLTGTTNTSTTEMILSTIGVSSGKWYWEVTPTSITSGGCMIGIRSTAAGVLANNFVSSTDGFGYYTTGNKYSPGASASYGASYTTNDVIGVALDMDAGTLTFYKNNASQGTAFTSISGTYTPGISNGGATSGCTVQINFGQRPFEYTPPTGFLKLNTFNLPDSTIEDGSDYFNTVLYSGNSSTQSITGVGFQPDWVWLKGRSQSVNHGLHDVLRVIGSAEAILSTNTTAAENTGGAYISSFDSDGFTLNSNSSGNNSGSTYVSWNWKANGSGVSNTDGSITSTVSANTTAGFSIVSYTGNGTNSTVGHGLNTAPEVVIVKDRDRATDWPIMFKAANNGNGQNGWIRLNLTAAWATTAILWNNTAPTSSVFSIGSYDYVNFNNSKYIAYCFAPVEGYSSFGSYTGNGSSTDGPFIYTGFRPAWILVKVATSQINATSWQIYDATRNTFNVIPTYLFADSAGAESDTASTYFNTDILSNGFKLRAANTYGVNQSGATYIYMAFAENPFKNSNAR